MGRPKRDFKPKRRYAIKQDAIAGRSVFPTAFDREDFRERAYRNAALRNVSILTLHIEHNHYHMIVEPGIEGDIPAMMRDTVSAYSREFNNRNKVRRGLPDTDITKFQNFGNRYHAAELDSAHTEIAQKHVTEHKEPTDCRQAPELAKDATEEQVKERDIIAALILATKWNRPVKYALARLAWWEERQRRRHAWRRHWAALQGSDPPG